MLTADAQADLGFAVRKGHFVGFVMLQLKCVFAVDLAT